MSVEEVLHRVVIGGSSYHHKVGITISRSAVERGFEIERLLGEILLNILVLYGRNALVDFLHLFGDNIHSGHLMMLRQERSYA